MILILSFYLDHWHFINAKLDSFRLRKSKCQHTKPFKSENVKSDLTVYTPRAPHFRDFHLPSCVVLTSVRNRTVNCLGHLNHCSNIIQTWPDAFTSNVNIFQF